MPTITAARPGVITLDHPGRSKARVTTCRFVGVAKIPLASGKTAEVEIYAHPTTGILFGLDARWTLEQPTQLGNFLEPGEGGLLDISDEPRNELLSASSFRFLRREERS